MKKRKDRHNAKWIGITMASLGIGFVVLVLLISVFSGGNVSANTAHIKIRGVITSGGESSILGGGTTSSEETVKNIQNAEENDRIKAILLDINSPGGSAVASEEIAVAIKNAEKPVVAIIRDIGTSGAYWAASAADDVVASPLSITGSVGATASYLEFSGLMEKYGIGYQRLVSGELKDTGAPFRKLQENEERMLLEMIKLTGDYFAESVKENRQLSQDVVEEIASGRFYTGQQALGLGLVDELGGIDRAKELIKARAGLDDVKLIEYKVRKPFSIASLLAQQAAVIGKNIGSSLLPDKSAISLT